MTEYIITRCDSMADNNGAGRQSQVTMGTVLAANHREANSWAFNQFCRNDCQWIELENAKTAKPARLNAARRIYQYDAS